MRENIGLFRGKRIDNGEWVEGYLTGALSGGFWIDESTKLGVPIIRGVDPDTIGECTGLKDKNGKLIFEGDIVKNDYGYIGQIIFKACSYYIEWKNGNFTIDLYVMADNLEIISNIHDNKELLKGGEGE